MRFIGYKDEVCTFGFCDSPEVIDRERKAYMVEQQGRSGGDLTFIIAVIISLALLISGCGGMLERYLAKSSFSEADSLFHQGNYRAALSKYGQIIEKYPSAADRVLFEMGIIYAYAGNEQKDYRKSLEFFQKLIKEYPDSGYRQNSEVMLSQLNNVLIKDKTIKMQQARIEALEAHIKGKSSDIITKQTEIESLRQDIRNKRSEIAALENKIEILELKIFSIQHGQADKILIEKKERRMTLLSKGKALKTYRIALGGNPVGPKERQGDNKTPEGTYQIDSRTRGGIYHISLHITYPNERDRKRARELGVSPGGDIMIHGLKNSFSNIGELHTRRDWTQGCIAVTNQEIEEIDKLAPNGTVVEIRP